MFVFFNLGDLRFCAAAGSYDAADGRTRAAG